MWEVLVIDNKNIAKVVYASCGENMTEGTKLSDNYVGNEIGRSMGLMPIIAPYVREQEKIVSNLRNIVNTEMLYDIPTIFVEGITDKAYLEIAIKLFSEKMWEDLENGKLRIYSKDGEDGCRSLVNRGLAWIYSGNKNKAYLLFDQDDAGKKSRSELIQNDIYKKGNGGRVKAELIVPSEMIRSIFDKKLNFTFEIEHLLSVEFWKVLKERDYLVLREFDEVCSIFNGQADTNRAITEQLIEKVGNQDLVQTLITYKPKDEKKTKIIEIITKEDDNKKKEIMSGFLPTIEKIELFLGYSSKN